MLIEMPITTDPVVRITLDGLSTSTTAPPLPPRTGRNRAEARKRKRPSSDREMRAKVYWWAVT